MHNEHVIKGLLCTWSWYWCIFADNSNIFRVKAVVASPSTMTTLSNAFFITNAMNIIKPNLRWCGEVLIPGTTMSAPCPFRVSQHTTYHICLVYSPVVVTDRSPGAIEVQFHPPLVRRLSITQTNSKLWNKQTQF